ncbi:hypothetical protein C0992_004150 [Termitomyces sp. T32_za158]|nr:hypothetical protein C0992_004150 [Termitomyces sp. T32_za158]
MALSMLAGGAECGPSNPLQGLSKRFDQDRGLQQDHFGAGTAGPSRETFRSATNPAIPDQDAARFFSANASQLPPSDTYDISALRAALPIQQQAHLLGPQLQKSASAANWAADFAVQRPLFSQTPSTTFQGHEVSPHPDVVNTSSTTMQQVRSGLPHARAQLAEQDDKIEVDANDAYFRQENAEYQQYWNDMRVADDSQASATNADVTHWERLQKDWDQFEATTEGIKQIVNYQFQENNPYLTGDSSTTRQHRIHAGYHSLTESVLQLEAAVQHDMNNAAAWYELGVKQQENEREQKAFQALQRSLELDPSHLPTWLALGVSNTNESNRIGTFDAINEWVSRNSRYEEVVQGFRAQNPLSADASLAMRYAHLIDTLIAMVRSNTSGVVDADTQIALAILLNTNEEYGKAHDCFLSALAVRPEDWLLYNRVGATMANSGRAEDALQYYYKALELNPGYIRARHALLAIPLRYEEAAQYILDALVLQDSDGVRDAPGMNETRGVTTKALWDSLKTTCLHMQRVDLATLCDRRDLKGL